MKRLALLLALAVSGCQSDTERLTELRAQESIARLNLLAAEQDWENKTGQISPERMTACYEEGDGAPYARPAFCNEVADLASAVSDARNQLDLANRDMNRFMR